MERREFIKATVAGVAATTIASTAHAQVETTQGGTMRAIGPVTSQMLGL